MGEVELNSAESDTLSVPSPHVGEGQGGRERTPRGALVGPHSISPYFFVTL